MCAGRNASIDVGFERFMGVHDLNLEQPIRDASGFDRPEVTHGRGQDAARAGDGVVARHRCQSGSWRIDPVSIQLESDGSLSGARLSKANSMATVLHFFWWQRLCS